MVNIFTSQEVKIKRKYTEDVYSDFMQKKFGIKTCPPGNNILASLRKEILDLQMLMDPITLYRLQNDTAELDLIACEPSGSLSITYEINNTATTVDNYVFTQSNASTTWLITHNLNLFPSVTVQDTNGNTIVASVEYLNSYVVRLNFNTAVAGTAYLS